jgi:hypothetical protein
MIIVLLVTQLMIILNNHCERKFNINDKLFYDMFPKRMAVYEETMYALNEISRKTPVIIKTPVEINREIYNIFRELFNLCNRLYIYGSHNSHVIIWELFNKSKVIFGISDFLPERPHIMFSQPSAEFSEFENTFSNFAICVDRHHALFAESVKGEIGENFIDKKSPIFSKSQSAKE